MYKKCKTLTFKTVKLLLKMDGLLDKFCHSNEGEKDEIILKTWLLKRLMETIPVKVFIETCKDLFEFCLKKPC